jgi:GT2 family glycosyltransferase
VSENPRLLGVLVTYRRPRDLERTLMVLASQDRRLDRLVVVDNLPTVETEGIVRSATDAAGAVDYLPMGENLGFPGGLATGMAALLPSAEDRDWIVVLDDDDPPEGDEVFGSLLGFGEQTLLGEPRTAAVGLRGARFDWSRGLLERVRTSDIQAAVPVDCIAGNAIPMYRVGALRAVGTFTPELFFSHEELDLGLRLEHAGYHLYAHGAAWKQRRQRKARPDDLAEERWRVAPNWRSYYSLRNSIYILRTNGRRGSAMRISVSRGFLKPLVNLPLAPRKAIQALRLNARACADAWRGRLGRRVEPDPAQPRPKKAAAAVSNAARDRT